MPTVCRQGARGVFRQPLKDHPCSALPTQGTPFPGTPYSKPHPLGAHQDIRVSGEGGLSPHFTHLEMLFYFVIFKNTIECIKNKQTYFWRRTDSEAASAGPEGRPRPSPRRWGPRPPLLRSFQLLLIQQDFESCTTLLMKSVPLKKIYYRTEAFGLKFKKLDKAQRKGDCL